MPCSSPTGCQHPTTVPPSPRVAGCSVTTLAAPWHLCAATFRAASADRARTRHSCGQTAAGRLAYRVPSNHHVCVCVCARQFANIAASPPRQPHSCWFLPKDNEETAHELSGARASARPRYLSGDLADPKNPQHRSESACERATTWRISSSACHRPVSINCRVTAGVEPIKLL